MVQTMKMPKLHPSKRSIKILIKKVREKAARKLMVKSTKKKQRIKPLFLYKVEVLAVPCLKHQKMKKLKRKMQLKKKRHAKRGLLSKS